MFFLFVANFCFNLFAYKCEFVQRRTNQTTPGMGPKPVKHIVNQSSLNGFVQNTAGSCGVGTLNAVSSAQPEWEKTPYCIRGGAVCYKHENGAYVRIPCEKCMVCGGCHI